MSYIDPSRKNNISFLIRLTSNFQGFLDILSDSSGQNMYVISKAADINGSGGNCIWMINSTTTAYPQPLSTTWIYGNGVSFDNMTSKYVLYNNQFLITTRADNISLLWWNFTFPINSGSYYWNPSPSIGILSGAVVVGNSLYVLSQSNFKVYVFQLGISGSTLTFSSPVLAAGGSGTNGVDPLPVLTTTGGGSGIMTFDGDGSLYITTKSNGVYKYNAGFQPTDTPINIIPYYNCAIGNIVYSKTYNLLYLSNTTNNNIDIFTTSGSLVISSYLGNTITTSRCANVGGSDIGMAAMAFDNMNTLIYSGNPGKSNGNGSIYIIYKIICFKEDTQILTMNGYKLIQNLRKSDLVKTVKHGYVPIYKIGFSEINHPCVEERVKDQLYKCSPSNYPEVFEDLVLTGCHNILVDSLISNEEREKAVELNGHLCITDDKYRLPVCLDERATVYDVPGTHTIYHMALEGDDYYMNYGIYANGLLVESTSKRFMDTTKMTLIE